MIHGGRVSDGCLPVGDSAIEELYALVNRVGAPKVSVVVSPVDLRRIERRARTLPRTQCSDLGPDALRGDRGKAHSVLHSEAANGSLVAGTRLGALRPKCKAYDAADCTRRCDKGDRRAARARA
jgi:hypothetical protein